jgi:hypothetical protein
MRPVTGRVWSSRESCCFVTLMTFDELPTFPSLELVCDGDDAVTQFIIPSTRTVPNQPAHSLHTPYFFSRNRYQCPPSHPQGTHATRTARPIHHLSYRSTTNPYPLTTASPTKTAGAQREDMMRGARSMETAPMPSIRIERGMMG